MAETLRELLENKYYDSSWYKDHSFDVDFELNHLELHDLDGYLLHLYNEQIKVNQNKNNSNIAYLIGITNQEPSGRIKAVGGSFPDIDTDFEHARRDDVKQHLKDIYGAEHVSGIGTFLISKCKGVFKDVARIYGLEFSKSNQISKLIPDDCTTIDDAIAGSKEIREMIENDTEIAEVFDYAKRLEGTLKAVGVHPSGFAITPQPITEIVPLFDSKGEAVTQFDGVTVEKIGIIKFDLLGLKNLTVISKTLELIEKRTGNKIDIDSISLDDEDVYKVIHNNNSLGVFQIEGSKGLRDFAAACKPTDIEDLSAIISLFRPGPMGMGALEEYIKRKADSTGASSKFEIPEYNYIFEKTYGLLIYQEQLMQLAKDMCGFNDIDADVLRKAVGKKDRELLLSQKEKFVQGAVDNGYDKERISTLFDTMEEFSRYCFNKAHAISYAITTYRTMWLKHYYPSEYMACLISEEIDLDMMSEYISDARRQGIEVLPPDVNQSEKDFSVGKNGEILFGFNCVKGIGYRAVEKILRNQPFNSIGDFLIKAYHAKGINKKVVDTLITCGAFDTFGYKRSVMLSAWEKFIFDYSVACGEEDKKQENNLTKNYIDITKSFVNREDEYFDDSMEELSTLEILKNEKELLGIHISGNPFDIVYGLIQEDTEDIQYLEEFCHKGNHTILVHVDSVKKTLTKAKKEMCFANVTDSKGRTTSVVVFPGNYEKVAANLNPGHFALMNINLKSDARGKSFIVNDVTDVTGRIQKHNLSESKGIKLIEIYMVGMPGIVQLRSVMSRIENYISDKDLGYKFRLYIDTPDAVYKIKEFNTKKIDVSTLRAFSKLNGVYISRGVSD